MNEEQASDRCRLQNMAMVIAGVGVFFTFVLGAPGWFAAVMVVIGIIIYGATVFLDADE